MGLMVVIAIVLAVCCLFKNKLNALLEIGTFLAIIIGVIYGVKACFDLSWTTTGLGIIIFALGSNLVSGKKK